MKLTADILARFAQARELDQRVKVLAAERGDRVTAEMYREAIEVSGVSEPIFPSGKHGRGKASVIDVIADNLEPIASPKIQDLEHCWREAIGETPDSTPPVDVE